MSETTDTAIDHALIASAFSLVAVSGWRRLSLAEAARDANLPLQKVRARFPNRLAVLMRFGSLADQSALTGVLTEGPVRDRLFDIVMRRIDALQAHRPGMLALLRELPTDPLTLLALAPASMQSAAWMLEGAGITATGLRGTLRIQGMMALWLATVRAWTMDDSEDLSGTMAALDKALDRAGQAEVSMSDLLGSDRLGSGPSTEITEPPLPTPSETA